MKAKLLLLPIALMLMISSARASVFTDALDRITHASLSLKMQNYNARADIQDMRNDNRLAAPEAEFGYLWGSNKEAGNKWDLSITQSFDWPGLYKARSKAIQRSSDAMDLLQKSAIVDVRMEGRLLLLEIIKCRQIIEIDSAMNADFHQLELISKKELDNGNMTRIDYNKAVIEHINSTRRLNESREALATLESQLSALVGNTQEAQSISRMVGSDYPNEDIPPMVTDDELRDMDPMVQAADANILTQEQLIKADKLSRYPGFSVGYSHETEAAGGFNGFTVGINLPMFTNKNKAKSARLRQHALETDRLIQLARRRADFASARNKAQSTLTTIKQLRPIVESESDLALLRKALEAGQISMRDYYLEVNYFLDVHRAYHETLYQYHLALAELHRFD